MNSLARWNTLINAIVCVFSVAIGAFGAITYFEFAKFNAPVFPSEQDILDILADSCVRPVEMDKLEPAIDLLDNGRIDGSIIFTNITNNSCAMRIDSETNSEFYGYIQVSHSSQEVVVFQFFSLLDSSLLTSPKPTLTVFFDIPSGNVASSSGVWSAK